MIDIDLFSLSVQCEVRFKIKVRLQIYRDVRGHKRDMQIVVSGKENFPKTPFTAINEENTHSLVSLMCNSLGNFENPGIREIWKEETLQFAIQYFPWSLGADGSNGVPSGRRFSKFGCTCQYENAKSNYFLKSSLADNPTTEKPLGTELY